MNHIIYYVNRKWDVVDVFLRDRRPQGTDVNGVTFYLEPHMGKQGLALIATHEEHEYKILEAGNGEYSEFQWAPKVFLGDLAISIIKDTYKPREYPRNRVHILPSIYSTSMNDRERTILLRLEKVGYRALYLTRVHYYSRAEGWEYFVCTHGDHHNHKASEKLDELEDFIEELENAQKS